MRLALFAALSAVVTLLVACGAEGIADTASTEEPAPAKTNSVQQAASTDGGTKASGTTWTYTNGGITHEDVWNAQH